jgi:hypothetical protein
LLEHYRQSVHSLLAALFTTVHTVHHPAPRLFAGQLFLEKLLERLQSVSNHSTGGFISGNFFFVASFSSDSELKMVNWHAESRFVLDFLTFFCH